MIVTAEGDSSVLVWAEHGGLFTKMILDRVEEEARFCLFRGSVVTVWKWGARQGTTCCHKPGSNSIHHTGGGVESDSTIEREFRSVDGAKREISLY